LQSQGLVAANNVNPALVGGTDEAQHRLGGWNGEMQEPDANFRERAGPRTSGEGSLTSSAQHNAPEPLPPRWLELLTKLNTEVGQWVFPGGPQVMTTQANRFDSARESPKILGINQSESVSHADPRFPGMAHYR